MLFESVPQRMDLASVLRILHFSLFNIERLNLLNLLQLMDVIELMLIDFSHLGLNVLHLMGECLDGLSKANIDLLLEAAEGTSHLRVLLLESIRDPGLVLRCQVTDLADLGIEQLKELLLHDSNLRCKLTDHVSDA